MVLSVHGGPFYRGVSGYLLSPAAIEHIIGAECIELRSSESHDIYQVLEIKISSNNLTFI